MSKNWTESYTCTEISLSNVAAGTTKLMKTNILTTWIWKTSSKKQYYTLIIMYSSIAGIYSDYYKCTPLQTKIYKN